MTTHLLALAVPPKEGESVEAMCGAMNPLCACGCGREVRLPTQKYILGHTRARKLAAEQVRIIKKAMAHGVSQYKLARMFGVSQSTISKFQWRQLDYVAKDKHQFEPIRQEQINENKRRTEWHRGRVELNKLKRLLRDIKRPNRWRSRRTA